MNIFLINFKKTTNIEVIKFYCQTIDNALSLNMRKLDSTERSIYNDSESYSV